MPLSVTDIVLGPTLTSAAMMSVQEAALGPRTQIALYVMVLTVCDLKWGYRLWGAVEVYRQYKC